MKHYVGLAYYSLAYYIVIIRKLRFQLYINEAIIVNYCYYIVSVSERVAVTIKVM